MNKTYGAYVREAPEWCLFVIELGSDVLWPTQHCSDSFKVEGLRV
jgi:hypothetical protein